VLVCAKSDPLSASAMVKIPNPRRTCVIGRALLESGCPA
jgi:hypothetical protein